MNLLDKIIEYVKNNPGCMAKDLARTFEVERSEINSLLYKSNEVIRDDIYRWYLKYDPNDPRINFSKTLFEFYPKFIPRKALYLDFEGSFYFPVYCL